MLRSMRQHFPVMPSLYSFTSIPALNALGNAFLTSMNAKYVGMPHILRMLIASISAYTASSVLRANWNPTCVNVMRGRLNLRLVRISEVMRLVIMRSNTLQTADSSVMSL